MQKSILPYGVLTALPTPFKDGRVDYASFGRIIEYQIENGVDGLVVLGTTGEAPTVSEGEREEIVKYASTVIKQRVPLIVGVGTNCTESTQRYVKLAHSSGANALLCVSPYYNKPTPNGLKKHFEAVAKSTDLPLILYNVPSRTGAQIPLSVYGELSNVENIVGIKEAGGSIGYLQELHKMYGDRYAVYTGNDDMTYLNLTLGGWGVISVISNLLPSKMRELCHGFSGGRVDNSLKIQYELLPIIKALFRETNPVPLKHLMWRLGFLENELRLPLCKAETGAELDKLLELEL